MKKEFVNTENDARFRAALESKAQRGASESGLIVVHGRAGEGKTRTLQNWASGCKAVMLTAKPSWTVRRMMVELADEFHIPQKGKWTAAVEAVIGADEAPVVVDEAGFALAANAACLEELRSITDKSGTLLVLAVMERDMDRLRQYDQLTSRAMLCPFGASTRADVAAACAQLSSVEFEPHLVERIHRETGARMRLVVEAINAVERITVSAGKRVATLADLAGVSLCDDFNRAVKTRHEAARTHGGAAKPAKAPKAATTAAATAAATPAAAPAPATLRQPGEVVA
jgi:DNA transposition AAA+ family ATPase